MKAHPELKKFLKPYDDSIQELTLTLRDFITDLVPEANELIWDNYNAVAIAYSTSEKLKDAFCHIAVYTKHVNVGFNRGAELTIGDMQLQGTGKRIRHIKVKDFTSFPKEEIEKLVWEAVSLSEKRNKHIADHTSKAKSIVMYISEKKIRPTKNTSK